MRFGDKLKMFGTTTDYLLEGATGVKEGYKV